MTGIFVGFVAIMCLAFYEKATKQMVPHLRHLPFFSLSPPPRLLFAHVPLLIFLHYYKRNWQGFLETSTDLVLLFH